MRHERPAVAARSSHQCVASRTRIFGTPLAEHADVVTIGRTTPAAHRHVIYAWHHALRIARGVAAAPWSRSSWGIILNLPWFAVVVPGRVYRSGSPRAAAHFRHVLELGIKTLICVRYGGPSRQLSTLRRQRALHRARGASLTRAGTVTANSPFVIGRISRRYSASSRECLVRSSSCHGDSTRAAGLICDFVAGIIHLKSHVRYRT